MRTVITFGTYDLFHYGHLRLLERAASHGDRLVVGVSTDELNEDKKGYRPVIPYEHRAAILEALEVVDEVFPERRLEDKRQYAIEHAADVLVMGADWEGQFDDELAGVCEVVYLDRTAGVSTTSLKRLLQSGIEEV